MQTLSTRLNQIREHIRTIEAQFQRAPASVQLLAVSKNQSAERIQDAYKLGQQDFGENYLQEALDKMQALKTLPICWHFIGRIQSNKTQAIASSFDWVHTIDRYKIAKRLSDQRPENFKPLNICLQVNLEQEASKAGIQIAELSQLAEQVTALPNIRLRGLMSIPARHETMQQQREVFSTLKAALNTLNQQSLALDTLSMGMSNDFEAAIAEGATIVRIGTGIFGPRQSPNAGR